MTTNQWWLRAPLTPQTCMMELLCSLFLCTALNNFSVSAKHIPGHYDNYCLLLVPFQHVGVQTSSPRSRLPTNHPSLTTLNQQMKTLLHNTLADNIRSFILYRHQLLYSFLLTIHSTHPDPSISHPTNLHHNHKALQNRPEADPCTWLLAATQSCAQPKLFIPLLMLGSETPLRVTPSPEPSSTLTNCLH